MRIVNSKSISFISETKHSLVHTFSDEGLLTLSFKKTSTLSISLVLINTKEEGVRLTVKDDGIKEELLFGTLSQKAFFQCKQADFFTVKKSEDNLCFSYGECELFTLKRSNFKAAVSIGLEAEGSGQALFSFSFV